MTNAHHTSTRQTTFPGQETLPITSVPTQVRVMSYEPPQFATEYLVTPKSWYERVVNIAGKFIGNSGLLPFCVCCPNPYVSIEQGTVGLVSRFGRFYKAVDPGLIKVNPLSESLTTLDVRLQLQPISRISIVTKDNVNVTIDAILYWHITNPLLATFGVVDVKAALIERAQTTLRAVLGSRQLQDIIENREEIALGIRDIIDIPSNAWGVDVESVLIKDLTFSPEVEESLSSVATQKRIGEGRIIAARAEVEAAKLLHQAAAYLNTPAAMQIKYLETMQHMAKGPNNKLLFFPSASPSWSNAGCERANPASDGPQLNPGETSTSNPDLTSTGHRATESQQLTDAIHQAVLAHELGES